MIDFYKNLRKGKSKYEALKLAKINFIKQNANSSLIHPYYWSGFVINGNTDPLEINSAGFAMEWLFLVFFGVVLIAYIYNRFK